MPTHSSIWPGEFHSQGTAGCSPLGCKGLDTTERLTPPPSPLLINSAVIGSGPRPYTYMDPSILPHTPRPSRGHMTLSRGPCAVL